MRRSWERTWKITLRVGGHIGGTVKHELSAMHDHERPPVTYAEAFSLYFLNSAQTDRNNGLRGAILTLTVPNEPPRDPKRLIALVVMIN
jgi:hypothetical protein